MDIRTAATDATIRVALAEDHAMVREGLTRLVRELPNVELVGVAEDGYEAVQLVEMLEPDILLLDITMPGLGGLGVLPGSRPTTRMTHAIMLSMHDNEEYVGAGPQGRAPRLSPEGFGPRRARLRDPVGDARRLLPDAGRIAPGHPRLHPRAGPA